MTKKVLASEIWRIIIPVSVEIKKNFTSKLGITETIDKLEEKSAILREQLGEVERYADLRNRELLNDAESVADSLKDISKALDGQGEYFEKYGDVTKAQMELRAGYKELMEKLEEIIGENLPPDNEGL